MPCVIWIFETEWIYRRIQQGLKTDMIRTGIPVIQSSSTSRISGYSNMAFVNLKLCGMGLYMLQRVYAIVEAAWEWVFWREAILYGDNCSASPLAEELTQIFHIPHLSAYPATAMEIHNTRCGSTLFSQRVRAQTYEISGTPRTHAMTYINQSFCDV